jgi:hypothetical protein
VDRQVDDDGQLCILRGEGLVLDVDPARAFMI